MIDKCLHPGESILCRRIQPGQPVKYYKKKLFKYVICFLTMAVLLVSQLNAFAEDAININVDGSQKNLIDIIGTLTLLALIPTIVIMTTAFTRIVIVLSFFRNAIGTQQSPPNQVLIGIAILLTLFVMSPVISEIDKTAYEPYKAGEITQEEFIKTAQVPLKTFMLKQTKEKDLNLFLDMSGKEMDDDEEFVDLPITTIVPAFITSELKRAFLIGFLLYIPFLIIDMVVSSALMSMGMMMLPPSMISLPFKLLLFVLVDGWGLLFKSLVMGFK